MTRVNPRTQRGNVSHVRVVDQDYVTHIIMYIMLAFLFQQAQIFGNGSLNLFVMLYFKSHVIAFNSIEKRKLYAIF